MHYIMSNVGEEVSEPQSLRTLRFGDRTISYDHEGEDVDSGGGECAGEKNIQINIRGVEGESESEGRHTHGI